VKAMEFDRGAVFDSLFPRETAAFAF